MSPRHCDQYSKHPTQMTIPPANGADIEPRDLSRICSVSVQSKKSSSTLVVEPLRVAHRCSHEVACRCAIFEIAPCDGSGFLAYARMRLEPLVRVGAVPRINPCPDSSGSGLPAFEGRLLRSFPHAPPSASRGDG